MTDSHSITPKSGATNARTASAAVTDASLGEILQRLRVLEDKAALLRLMNTYSRLADEFKPEEWGECWTEDAVIESPRTFGHIKGRDIIVSRSRGEMGLFQAREHLITNMEFDIDGDKAKGFGAVLFIGLKEINKPHENFMTGGFYHWDYTRTSSGWKIAAMTLEFFWNRATEVPPTFNIRALDANT
jgi:SnoaL-like domain